MEDWGTPPASPLGYQPRLTMPHGSRMDQFGQPGMGQFNQSGPGQAAFAFPFPAPESPLVPAVARASCKIFSFLNIVFIVICFIVISKSGSCCCRKLNSDARETRKAPLEVLFCFSSELFEKGYSGPLPLDGYQTLGSRNSARNINEFSYCFCSPRVW
jgi:hypothetical protein